MGGGGGGRGRGEARSVAEKRSGDGHGDGEGEGEGDGKRGGGAQKVPLHRLFTFADVPDVTLMVVGTAAAVANGLAMPLMTFIFGQLIDAFGVANRESVVRSVAKVNFQLNPAFSFLVSLFPLRLSSGVNVCVIHEKNLRA